MLHPLKHIQQNRLLLTILLPVMAVGLAITLVADRYLTPSLYAYIQNRIESELRLASELGLEVCENHLNYLLELRLEDDRDMNTALRNEALEEIERISGQFQKIHMLVIHRESGTVLKSSDDGIRVDASAPGLELGHPDIVSLPAAGSTVRLHARYFPFWRWQIASFIREQDYLAPIQLVNRIVLIGTGGVLGSVFLTLFLVILFFVREPLKRVIEATRGITGGAYQRIRIDRNDEIGRVVRAFNAMVEGLERKDREVEALIRAVRNSEQRYRVLFDEATEGILAIEVETERFLYANHAICDMLGVSESELEGRSLVDIHPKDARAWVLNEYESMEADEKALISNIPCVRGDGALFYADIKGTRVMLDQRLCRLCFFTDVTARRKSEQEMADLQRKLQRAEKMEALGVLAGGVAHDLNNILSGIVTYPELLLMDLPEDSPLRKPIETMERSGKKASAIVQDLLALARRGVAVTEILNLNDVVSDYLRSPECEKLRHYHPQVDIVTDLEDNLLNIMGSPVHLSKTLMNLVSNASEATLSGGRVHVSTRNQYVDRPLKGYDEVSQGDYVVLSVRDTGVGIADEDLERIFEPFYTKKAMGRSGTGLGMALVWGTVKDHQGYIDVTSQTGRGTLIELYFPVTRKEKVSEGESLSVAALAGHGETILVVDDVSEQREIAERLLGRLGYDVTSVASGEEAVEAVKTAPVDLLVLDMIMDPGMDGLDTFRKILEVRPEQKAIIVSGFSETERVKEARRLGVRKYVRKPYTLGGMGLAVKQGLGKK